MFLSTFCRGLGTCSYLRANGKHVQQWSRGSHAPLLRLQVTAFSKLIEIAEQNAFGKSRNRYAAGRSSRFSPISCNTERDFLIQVARRSVHPIWEWFGISGDQASDRNVNTVPLLRLASAERNQRITHYSLSVKLHALGFQTLGLRQSPHSIGIIRVRAFTASPCGLLEMKINRQSKDLKPDHCGNPTRAL